MQKIFQEYGGVITTAMAIVALISVIGLFFTSNGDGWMDNAFHDVVDGFVNKVDEAVPDQEPASCGIDGHYANDGKTHGEAVTDCDSGHTYTCECTGWVVPEDGTYYVGVTSTTLGTYTGATATYTAGQQLPCGYVAQEKDVYVSGDYEYRYNYYYENVNGTSKWWLNSSQNGWSVKALSTTKATYGEIQVSINGKPVTDMTDTFDSCTNLESITIPDSVTSIGANAFSGCENLTTVTFGENSQLTSIGESAFYKCKNLTSITIPDSVTNIDGYAFYSCNNLTSIIFGDNSQLATIGEWAFAGPKPTNITLSGSLASIGDCAFNYCKGLTSITFQGTKVQWNAVSKLGEWNRYCNAITVTCTDGIVTVPAY